LRITLRYIYNNDDETRHFFKSLDELS